jgi:hypothetical protein
MPITPSPAPRAFSVLYGIASKYVHAPSDTEIVTLSKEGLNSGLYRINGWLPPWFWTRTYSDVTLATNAYEYAAPNDLGEIRRGELLNSGGKTLARLDFIPNQTFELHFPNRSGSGSLSAFTVNSAYNQATNAGKFTMDQTPNAAFIAQFPTLRVWYNRRLALYSADADTLTTLGGAPSEVEEFLLWTAREYLASILSPDAQLAFASRKAEFWWTHLVNADRLNDTQAW